MRAPVAQPKCADVTKESRAQNRSCPSLLPSQLVTDVLGVPEELTRIPRRTASLHVFLPLQKSLHRKWPKDYFRRTENTPQRQSTKQHFPGLANAPPKINLRKGLEHVRLRGLSPNCAADKTKIEQGWWRWATHGWNAPRHKGPQKHGRTETMKFTHKK